MKPLTYIVFLLFAKTLFTQGQNMDERKFDFFGSEEILHISLSFDMREYVKSKSDPKNLDALLTVKISDYDSINTAVRIKARGQMRRNYCSFPPMLIKMKDSRLKLVTHCNQTAQNENYVFKEYLAYKLFNLVTPYSFKTRLVQINYTDLNNPRRSISSFGFLIENDDNMALRNNAVVLDNDNISQKHMNERDMARVALFNYMIGNTDWSVLQQHNIKVLVPRDTFSNKGIPVAYDFDYSGFVQTSYSAPTEGLPIKMVTERYYLGNCIIKEELQVVMEQFEDLKYEFLSTIDEFEYLPDASKRKLAYYINGFFRIQRNQDVLLSQLNRTCQR